MADKLKSKAKAHTIYKTSDGKRVPSVTTILSLLNKPYLIQWANKLGLEGIDSTKYRDEAAEIGTLAHAIIQSHLAKEELDYTEYSALHKDLAENAVLSFLEWEKNNKIEPLLLEKSLVSDKKEYGGTVDCYCLLNGEPTLVDFKTGKAIYDEYFVQVSAYAELLKEHGYPVNKIVILRVGRDSTEGFETRAVSDYSNYYKIFENLLEIYKTKKILKWS